MKERIQKAIRKNKLIAIVRGAEAEACICVAQALYDGGFRLMEITYDQKHRESWENTARAIGAVAKAFEGKMYVGAGTVTCTELVDLTHQYDGQFIISPDVNEEVIRRTCALGMVSIPGALTPTEIMRAHHAGADFVKLFPAGNLGLDYIKAIMAPISHVNLLVVGGIKENDVQAYLDAGITGFGIGSNIVSKARLESKAYDQITELARKYVKVIEK